MTATREITYISTPAAVSMADKWFEVATTDHFWIHRRFEVFQELAGQLVLEAKEIAEIGCGNGLLQRQIEEKYGRTVVGCDLNDYALKRNVSLRSPILCYDIFKKNKEMYQRFDFILLFDVLEHITEEGEFIEAIKFHLAPGGRIAVNVPAGQWAFSSYDRAAGHVRRYSSKMLQTVVEEHRLKVRTWTYWGLPLVPALLLRKIWLGREKDQDKIILKGFDSRSKFADRCLRALAKCEPIPQKFLGTSLLAVLEAGSE
jgi:2-polyprenyl-3-methyl-5-hydroxy-6-metoxy-1,4-benzoquinol methylase